MLKNIPAADPNFLTKGEGAVPGDFDGERVFIDNLGAMRPDDHKGTGAEAPTDNFRPGSPPRVSFQLVVLSDTSTETSSATITLRHSPSVKQIIRRATTRFGELPPALRSQLDYVLDQTLSPLGLHRGRDGALTIGLAKSRFNPRLYAAVGTVRRRLSGCDTVRPQWERCETICLWRSFWAMFCRCC